MIEVAATLVASWLWTWGKILNEGPNGSAGWDYVAGLKEQWRRGERHYRNGPGGPSRRKAAPDEIERTSRWRGTDRKSGSPAG